MDSREQLHKLVDDLDDETVKPGLHANVDDLDDASLPAALVRMRALGSLFDRLAGSEKLHGLTAALIGDAPIEAASKIPAYPLAPQATLAPTPSLRYGRTQLAVPQRELAGIAKVSINTVQRLEAGGTARLTTVRRLAEALEIKPADLMAQPPEG